MPQHPIEKLRHEHSNMLTILTLIRSQFDLLDRKGTPDFVLLANALYYLRKFQSVVHHPKEDRIIQQLLDAGFPQEEAVERLRQQHQDIYALEDRLIELILEAQTGNRGHIAKLLELGRHYLSTQTQHVETEERILFPQALKRLKKRDWEAVRDRTDRIDDPLFGGHPTEHYKYLYDYLLREAL